MFIIVIGIVVSGCFSRNANDNELPAGKYVALLETIKEDYEFVNGTGIPMMAPQPAFFDYDGSRGTIQSHANFNDSLKIIYGTYYSTYSPRSNKANLYVMGIYDTPYSIDANLSILDVDKNGTVHMSFRNESFYLKTGDKWESQLIDQWAETINQSTRTLTQVNNETIEIPGYINYTTVYYKRIEVQNEGVYDITNVTKK